MVGCDRYDRHIETNYAHHADDTLFLLASMDPIKHAAEVGHGEINGPHSSMLLAVCVSWG